jgi:5-carboxymethyl-2-hydroxymuconic-semialdehyde dehydrogenase
MQPTIITNDIRISPAHYIDGRRMYSPRTFATHSPIDGRLLGQVCLAQANEVKLAVSAASETFPKWAALSPGERQLFLNRFADEIEKRSEALSYVESIDAGVLYSRMRHSVIARSALNLRHFARKAHELQNRVLESESATHKIRYDPAGVVAVITPWNAPLLLATWKIGPALAAGNTCVLKAPEWAPLTSSLLADAADEAGLPAGVLNIVQGDGAETGAHLVDDPRLARISFTGSAATAKAIARCAAKNLIPCSLELGGKSPFIVLRDADVQAAAQTAALMYRNAGQVCLAGTRLLVDESLADAFLDALRHHVKRLRVGDPRDVETEVGPLIHARQLENVAGYVERARADGAEIVWGGHRHAFGANYYAPTLIAGVGPDDEIVQNEVFGPVLTLQTFADDDEAIALANGTDYGLGGMCYGERAHAERVAQQVQTGFIWINSFGIRDLDAPFGGIKRSGIGREGGEWSFDFFANVKDIIVPKRPFHASFSQR